MRITYIGHATLLIQIGGKTILTDPNFDPALGRFLRRVSQPGIALDRLPKLDMVLLTHAHADHLSFRSLDALGTTPVFAPPAVARWLVRKGYTHAVELPPGDCVESGALTIRAASAVHKGNRYAVDRWMSDSNMYLIDTNTLSCFFAGDTALTPSSTHLVDEHLTKTGRQLDMALLPIGHAPWWKFGFRKGHLTSADALLLFERLRARFLIPYHWGTFNHVTSTAFDAIDRLRIHLETHPRRPDVRILEPGMTFDITAVE